VLGLWCFPRPRPMCLGLNSSCKIILRKFKQGNSNEASFFLGLIVMVISTFWMRCIALPSANYEATAGRQRSVLFQLLIFVEFDVNPKFFRSGFNDFTDFTHISLFTVKLSKEGAFSVRKCGPEGIGFDGLGCGLH